MQENKGLVLFLFTV